MKKIIYFIFLILIIIPNNIKAYTRKDLEDIIVSTGLSYYYNNSYTDYEGVWHDDAESLYTNNYNITPEMIGRSNYMITQCDAFVSSVYIHSLGYDFSKYREKLGTGRYSGYYIYGNSKYILPKETGETEFKNLYKYFNKAFSVGFMNSIAKDKTNDFDGIAIYYKSCPEKDSNHAACLNEAATFVKNNIRPGDILLNDGHAMLWVGDVLEPGNGAIHSSGTSYNFEKGYSGYDDYSVRYSDSTFIIENQVKKHGDNTNTIVAILRPINYFCGNNTNETQECKNTSTFNDNVKARREFKRLRVEQYIYDPNNGRNMSYINSSIDQGDTISYRLYLSNKSVLNVCSHGKKAKKEDCPNDWKTLTNNKKYSGITITAKIPSGTTYVTCSNGCTKSGDTITWSNVTIDTTTSETFYYTVRVNNDTTLTSIKNDGMVIKYNDKTLTMSKIETKVNSTITGKYSDIFKEQVKNDINSKCSNSKSYVIDFYNRYFKNSNIKLSNTNNLSTILTYDNIINAGFNKYGDYFRRKMLDPSDKTSPSYAINQMMVKNIYGGRKYQQLLYTDYLSKMESLRKVVPIWSTVSSLNIGDIVIIINGTTIDAMLYTGVENNNQTFTYCNNGYVYKLGKTTTTYNGKSNVTLYSNRYFLDKVHNSDLYLVLRPSAYYKPKLSYTLTYNVNGGDAWTSTTCPSGFTFDSGAKTCKKTREYKNTYGSFPKPTRNGYTLSGWVVYLYNSTTKKYDIKTPIKTSDIFDNGANKTVYAQWTPKIYSVMLDTKENMIYEKYNTSWCSDEDCKTTITKVEVPKKSGYTFQGYYTGKNGTGKMIIDSNGNIVNDTTKTFYFEGSATSGVLYSYFVLMPKEEIVDANQIIKDIYNQILDKVITDKDENGVSHEYIITKKPYSYKKVLSNIKNDVIIEIKNKNDNIYTGGKTTISKDNKKIKEYINILLGDINGDGNINSSDYVKIKKHIMKTEIISKKIYYIASDVNRDTKITSSDYIKIKKYIMNGGVL